MKRLTADCAGKAALLKDMDGATDWVAIDHVDEAAGTFHAVDVNALTGKLADFRGQSSHPIKSFQLLMLTC